jgi:hypothetical protein
MTALGQTPFGTSRFGGAGQIVIRGALPISRHQVLVDFDKPPQAFDRGGYESATNPKNWALAAVDPTVGTATPPTPVPTYAPAVIAVDHDDALPMQVVLYTDLPMEAGVYYDVTAQPALRGAACETLVDATTWRVLARRAPRRPTVSVYYVDRYRDLATSGGRIVLTESGDIDTASGVDALKIRLYRRITTALGGFVMLTGYGVDLRLKDIMRPGEVQAIANAITAQLGQEPDVERGSATVAIVDVGGATVLRVSISVVRREGADHVFVYDFPYSEAT